MRYSIADRLKARARQLGINAAHVAELAGVNRSFVYDIMRGSSENPNLDRLQRVAEALKVEQLAAARTGIRRRRKPDHRASGRHLRPVR